MKETILVIDDDQEHNALLKEYLGRHGYIVETAEHPETGLESIEKRLPDLIVLDLMLPDMDGFTVCKKIRERYSVPVLMLTARGDIHDRIVGLEIGADDYIPKPFDPRELVARIRALLRRSYRSDGTSSTEKLGALLINYDSRTVSLDGRNINLTANEYELLVYLARNRWRVLDRNQIVEHLRGIDWEASNRSADMLISRLRQKLDDDPKNPKYIKTVTGAGYLFTGGGGDES